MLHVLWVTGTMFKFDEYTWLYYSKYDFCQPIMFKSYTALSRKGTKTITPNTQIFQGMYDPIN